LIGFACLFEAIFWFGMVSTSTLCAVRAPLIELTSFHPIKWIEQGFLCGDKCSKHKFNTLQK